MCICNCRIVRWRHGWSEGFYGQCCGVGWCLSSWDEDMSNHGSSGRRLCWHVNVGCYRDECGGGISSSRSGIHCSGGDGNSRNAIGLIHSIRKGGGGLISCCADVKVDVVDDESILRALHLCQLSPWPPPFWLNGVWPPCHLSPARLGVGWWIDNAKRDTDNILFVVLLPLMLNRDIWISANPATKWIAIRVRRRR